DWSSDVCSSDLGAATKLLRVCAPAGGGNTAIGASCPAGDNTVGYVAVDANKFAQTPSIIADTTARYVVAGKGVRTNVARNSFYSPGFSVLNLSDRKS